MPIMGGWKTWIAVAGMVLLGIYDIIQGETDQGITKIAGAFGLIGIGAKIEKARKG